MTATRTSHVSDRLACTLVGDVMRPGVVSCAPSATVPEMARMMVTHGIHAVLVAVHPQRHPLVVSDLELIDAALQDAGVRADGLARDPIATVATDAPLTEAVAIMSTRSVSHLLAVHPRTGAAAGVVSTLDLAAFAAEVRPDLARMQRPAPARPSPSATDLQAARVADLMHTGVTTADIEAPISTLARIMADHRIHCAAVSGIDSSPGREQRLTWGLVEALDVVGALHRDQFDAAASAIADTAPLAVRDTDAMLRAAALMVEHERRHLVAVSATRLAAGIVSTLDVARVLANRAS